MDDLTDFNRGLLIGVLVGEGSFGGDGKQPQISLRMHTRHEALFNWLMECFPRAKLYGPYHHSNRSYYQWMARGAVLVEDVLPVLEKYLTPEIDTYAHERFQAMITNYADFIARVHTRAVLLQ